MNKVVFLDTGILGIVTHPRAGGEAKECIKWLLDLVEAGNRVCVPEICDYELRREYEHLGQATAIEKLNQLNSRVCYVPLNTQMMNRAAELWADVRRKGMPTADPKELDGDAILAAQAILSVTPNENPVVATTNVGHLLRFLSAERWQDIGSA